MNCRIMILNYNGKTLLEKYLPQFKAAIQRSKYSCKLTVLDNKSVDGSVDYLKNAHPDVDIFEATENKVLCSYNEAARAYSEDIFILMNNDIGVDKNFIDPLLSWFERYSNVFMVTPKCISQGTGTYEGGITRARIKLGMFWASSTYCGYERDIHKPALTFSAGFGAFSREKFMQLGGYDELYLPGRLEDSDICLQAYRAGYRCVYEPASTVYHEGGVSFHKAFGVSGTLVVNWRNTFLFMWKNFSVLQNTLITPLLLTLWFAKSLLSFNLELPTGFFQALKRIGMATRRRSLVSTHKPATRIFALVRENDLEGALS